MAHQPVSLGLKVGDRVRVLSFQDIHRTLDTYGTYEGLPFMPEMAVFCGHSYRVTALVDRTCVEGVGMGSFRGGGVVLLKDLRCDGSAHDGCEKLCTIFWKEAWLTKEVRKQDGDKVDIPIMRLDQLRTKSPSDKYFCQSTELSKCTRKISILEGVTSNLDQWGEWKAKFIGGWRIIHNHLQAVFWSIIAKKRKKVDYVLDLRPGQRVRVKSNSEIVKTLDRKGSHRGLVFPRGMFAFCDKGYIVKSRLGKMIDEQTATMKHIKNTVVLDSNVCDGIRCHGLCPRRQYNYWREAWLILVEENHHKA